MSAWKVGLPIVCARSLYPLESAAAIHLLIGVRHKLDSVSREEAHKLENLAAMAVLCHCPSPTLARLAAADNEKLKLLFVRHSNAPKLTFT